MAVVGFSFLRFDCLKAKKDFAGKLEISHNVAIESVVLSKLNLGSGPAEVLQIGFTFSVRYGEDLGRILLSGEVVFSDVKEIVSECFKAWEHSKKLPELVNSEVSKFVYTKGIVKALALSDDLNLPAPIPVVPQGMFEKKSGSDFVDVNEK